MKRGVWSVVGPAYWVRALCRGVLGCRGYVSEPPAAALRPGAGGRFPR